MASPGIRRLFNRLYDHKLFIRNMVASGFPSLLWAPEVRDCQNGQGLLRHLGHRLCWHVGEYVKKFWAACLDRTGVGEL